jgi:flagellar biosynthetic protein FliR
MSGFLSMLGYVLILSSDQHHTMLRSLVASYSTFPAGTVVQSRQWFDALMHTAGQIFVIGWKIALPVFVATLLVEMTVAFIARMHPQISIMVVTAPLKLYIGMLVLGASLAFFPGAIREAFNVIVLRK